MRHLIVLLLATLLPAFGWTEEQPDWPEFQPLLGKKIDAQEVVAFVEKYQLRKGAKGGSGSFTAPHESYSVMFEEDTVDTIVLQASPWPKDHSDADWTVYAKALPGKLSPDDDRRAVERKLGSSTHPGGDWWRSGELTIWVIFNKQESRIDKLYVWRTKDRPGPGATSVTRPP